MFLKATGLGHDFAGMAPLFRDIDVNMVGGDIVALMGPSGSGKSTMLGILAGWITATVGVVERVGIEVVTWVPQNPYGSARRSTQDHATLALLARGVSRSRAEIMAGRTLAQFGLTNVADSPFAALSGGEGQRLMLARASLSNADLILVDEPTAQLDPSSARMVIDSLSIMAGDGKIVVVATHDPKVSAKCTKTVTLGEDVTTQKPRS